MMHYLFKLNFRHAARNYDIGALLTKFPDLVKYLLLCCTLDSTGIDDHNICNLTSDQFMSAIPYACLHYLS